MHSELKKIIERVYVERNFKFFIEQSKKKIEFIDELISLVSCYCETADYNVDGVEPSLEIYFSYKDLKKDDMVVAYHTLLRISKIASIFIFQHEFSIDNPDKDRMSPVLDGFDSQAYTKTQNILEDVITKFLLQKNYFKVSNQEMEEVICNVKMPDNNLFGCQMTVDNALFRDIWDICCDKDSK